jgi:uncharacterized membrane protein
MGPNESSERPTHVRIQDWLGLFHTLHVRELLHRDRRLSQRLAWHHLVLRLRPHDRDHTRISITIIFQGSYFVTSKWVVLRSEISSAFGVFY